MSTRVSAPRPDRSAPAPDPVAARGPVARLKRLVLISGMSLATINIWTGSPLLGLWVGSRMVSSGNISMLAVATVAVTIGGVSFALIRVLGVLGGAYDRLAGRRPMTRQHTPWLRSMSGGRPHEAGPDYRLSALDRLLVLSVVVVVAAFEIWFFFYSSSPLDGRSGRS